MMRNIPAILDGIISSILLIIFSDIICNISDSTYLIHKIVFVGAIYIVLSMLVLILRIRKIVLVNRIISFIGISIVSFLISLFICTAFEILFPLRVFPVLDSTPGDGIYIILITCLLLSSSVLVRFIVVILRIINIISLEKNNRSMHD